MLSSLVRFLQKQITTETTSAPRGAKTAKLRLQELEERLPPANDIFFVPGADGEQTSIDFNWIIRRADFNNEIGVYVVDDQGRVNGIQPGSLNYASAAINSGQTLFQAGQRQGARNILQFQAGTRLAFYLIPNGNRTSFLQQSGQLAPGTPPPIAYFSIDNTSFDGFDHTRGQTQLDGGFQVSFEDLPFGGDRDFNDAIINMRVTTALFLPPDEGESTPVAFTLVQRESGMFGEIGFFRTDNAFGTINGISPGDPRYAAVALSSAGRQTLFNPNSPVGTQQNFSLDGGGFFGLYLIQNNTADGFLQQNPTNTPGGPGGVAFFSFQDANPDGLNHIVYLSANQIGFEDTLRSGDQDFNDAVVEVNIGAAIPDTSPPTISVSLVNDTGTRGDGITSDPTISGRVQDAGTVVSLLAGLNNTPEGSFTDITSVLNEDGTFMIDRALLTTINGGTLPDGLFTLRLRATDQRNNLGVLNNFNFTLDSTATGTTLLLDPNFDTGTAGDSRTDRDTVRLTGTAEANAQVRLVRTEPGQQQQTIATTTANALGQFEFTNVSLDPGANGLKVFVTDGAGNQGESGITIGRNSAPIVSNGVANVTVIQNASPTLIDLSNAFSDADGSSPIVRFDTVFGAFNAQLFVDQTPLHTSNFLAYANANDYDTTFIHRSVPGFVVQGGGFEFLAGQNPNNVSVTARPAVTNEPGLPNSRGTIALAKLGGDPNSGTSQFFFNLADNTTNLDNQNGGFTVFGQVLGNGQQIVDQIAAVPTFNLGGAFTDIPLRNNFTGNDIQQADGNNFVLINDVSVVPNLTFTVAGNTNPDLVTPSIVNNQLTLTYTAGMTGTATITLRAADADGSSVMTTFTVTVN